MDVESVDVLAAPAVRVTLAGLKETVGGAGEIELVVSVGVTWAVRVTVPVKL